MAIETRGKWTDLIADTGLRIAEVVNQGDELYTPGIFKLLNTKSADSGAQKNYRGITPFGRLASFNDGDDIPMVERSPAYLTKVLYNNYGAAVQVTANQISDREFDAELSEMMNLSRSYNETVDFSSMQLFNGGFATTVSVNGYLMTWYGDAKPQYSTIHPTQVPGGSTQSNASSTGIRLGHANLDTGRLALTLQKTDNALPLSMTGKITLVVPLALEKTGFESIMSPLTPETSNNALNFYKGSIDMVSSQYLDSSNNGSSTAWFLLNTQRHALYYETRQGKNVNREVNILNKTVTFAIDARWTNYSLEWKGTWASKGDLAAYSS